MPKEKEKIMFNGYFDHYLTKPFDMYEIIKQIKGVLYSPD